MSSKAQILQLYKSLLRESQKFAPYNFRLYAIRRVQDAFRDNRNIVDKEKLKEFVAEGHRNLAIIKRQALISRMYETDKLVIENIAKN